MRPSEIMLSLYEDLWIEPTHRPPSNKEQIVKLEPFVRKFADNMIGLDVVDYSVFEHFGRITITIAQKKINGVKAPSSEWRDTAEQLIEELRRNAFGDWEIEAISKTYCEVKRTEK